MQVGVIGLNHKSADVQLRERLATVCERRLHPDNSTHGMHALVLISTCNRIEVYFSSDDLAATHSYILRVLRRDIEEEFDHLLYSYFRSECFAHLCRVTAGLDSAVIGETEIQGQVKKGYEASCARDMLPQALHFTFQKALKIGKMVRAATQELCIVPSVEKAIFDYFTENFGTAYDRPILFVGGSQINCKIIQYFCKKGMNNIHLCNRTAEKVRAFCEQEDITFVSWERHTHWEEYVLSLFATKYHGYLLKPEHFPSGVIQERMVVDLSVPRNVDPALSKFPGVHLFNVDDIGNIIEEMRKIRMTQAVKAETLVAESIDRQIEIYCRKAQQRFANDPRALARVAVG